jgi:hypothetical protein
MSSGPTQFTITYIPAGGSSSNTASVTVSIPKSLQDLNSGQTVESLSGFNSGDVLLDAIYRRRYFYNADRTAAISTGQILSITWS